MRDTEDLISTLKTKRLVCAHVRSTDVNTEHTNAMKRIHITYVRMCNDIYDILVLAIHLYDLRWLH